MGKGGATRKLILDGLDFELSSDNDMNFTIGGFTVTEYQETTGKPFFLSDKISGALKGAEGRMSHVDGTLDNFNAILKKCAEVGPVSALWIPADGAKYTASGGAMIVVTGAADGMMTTREGKLSFDVIPANGYWTRM